MEFEVRVDRGFRGVPAEGVAEFDDNDPEVREMEKKGFLVPVKKTSPPAPAIGHGEDDDEKKEG